MSHIIVKEQLPPTCNVRVTLLDENYKEIQRIERHNVFTNMGRNWIRDLISVPTYAYPERGNVNVRPMYHALGVGGAEQTETPPGGGTYTEIQSVTNLELPVIINRDPELYWAQCSAQPDLTDTGVFPDPYTVRYRSIILPNQVSFAEQPTYGTLVPISEAALFTSACTPATQLPPGPPSVAIGMIAYAVFPPVYKTSANLLEVIWEIQS